MIYTLDNNRMLKLIPKKYNISKWISGIITEKSIKI
jgi:hypothetical protein